MTPEATMTQPNVLATPEAFSEHDAIALGSLSMEGEFTFSDADLQFLATGDESVLAPAIQEHGDSPLAPLDQKIRDNYVGINADSLTGNLSAQEQARLEAIDRTSAQAATNYLARQDEVATATHAAAQHQAEQAFVQHEIIDADELKATAAKKKKSEFALVA